MFHFILNPLLRFYNFILFISNKFPSKADIKRDKDLEEWNKSIDRLSEELIRILLSTLPAELQTPPCTYLELYSAIDAIEMYLDRTFRAKPNDYLYIYFNAYNDLFFREIEIMAKVDTFQAEKIFTYLLNVARVQGSLFKGFSCFPIHETGIKVFINYVK